MNTYLHFVLRFRWLSIVLAIVLLLMAIPGLSRIVVLSDSKSFLSANYPPLLQLEEMDQIFTENQDLSVIIAPANGTVFDVKTIDLIQQLTEQFWLLPHASRVNSITNFQYTQVDGDDLLVGDLFPGDEPISSDSLARGKRVSSSEPVLINGLISASQDVAVIAVGIDIPDGMSPTEAYSDIVIAAKTMLADYQTQYPDTELLVSGIVVMNYAVAKYGMEDSTILIPAMLSLMAFMLLLITRSVSSIIAASMVVIFTGLGTMGLLGWIGWIIDPASAVAPIVIMTLAIADSIHIIEGMQNAMRLGAAKRAAILQSLKDNFTPVFLTSLTTVLGVATFTFSEIVSLQRLGITIGLGVTVAFLLSITLLPALLSVLPMQSPKIKNHSKSILFPIIIAFSVRYYRLILPIALLLSIGVASLATYNNFNDSVTGMMAKSTPEQQAVDFYENRVSGIVPLDIAIFTDTPSGINDPQVLQTLESFVVWLRELENISHVSSITDTIKRLNQNMNQDNPDWYRMPQERDLSAQYLLLYEMSLPYGLDLGNQINIDKSGLRMTAQLAQCDTQKLVESKRAIEQWFADNAPELQIVVTGASLIMAELSYLTLIPSLIKGGMVAMLMVSIVLLAALRSVKLGFAAMLANVIPVSVGYGLWYLINGEVNFIIAGVAGVCLGVVVDFAVHFLSKYQRSRQQGQPTETALHYAFDQSGRPLLTTTLVLVSGFWLLMLSKITLNSGMGTLTGIIILLALTFVFLVLPSVLLWLDKSPSSHTTNLTTL